MADIFLNGDILTSELGGKYVVEKKTGFIHGSEYYLVKRDDSFFGMRAYSFMPTSQFIYVKKKLYRTDIPKNVNWPIEYVKNDKGFGIIEKIVDERFKSFWDLAKNKISPSFEALINSCINLASVVKSLHEKNLIFNGEQVLLLDPGSGDIFIENYDCIYSISDNMPFYGSYRFEAPELFVEGNKPNEKTDLHMLAVYIFYLLMVSFPYEGKKEYEKKTIDLKAIQEIYGSPVYIFDPNNDSNRPVKDYHNNAIVYHDIYPDYINIMFERAFIDGAHNPEKRISEDEWINCLNRLKSDIIKCECGACNFINANPTCWNCKKSIKQIVTSEFDTNLCERIINKYVELIEEDDSDNEYLSHVNRKRLAALLSNDLFNKELISRKGFKKIYNAIVGKEFEPPVCFDESDFVINESLFRRISSDTDVDLKVLKFIIYLEESDSMLSHVVAYINICIHEKVMGFFIGEISTYGESDNVINQIYKLCPSIMFDRKKLKAYLMDYIPDDKKLQNVICLSFDEGIPQELEKCRDVDNIIIQRLKNKLIHSYDVSDAIADKVVKMWVGTIHNK